MSHKSLDEESLSDHIHSSGVDSHHDISSAHSYGEKSAEESPQNKDKSIDPNDSNSDVISLDSEASNDVGHSNQPVAIGSGRRQIDRPRRRSSLLRSITPQSFDSNKLSKAVSSYSIKDIYGDLDADRISLIRTQSRKSIMKTLSSRLDASNPYKDVPDISIPTKDYGKEFDDIDPELITWEDDDPNYPRNWPTRTKVFQTLIVSLYTLISPMSSSISSPATSTIAAEFGITNTSVMALTVSIMVLAFAIGPLIIAPLSESDRIGRRPVLNLSIWILLAFNLGCGFTHTTTQLCVLRFLGGLGGCAALNVGAGTLADLFDDKTRNFAMAAYSICPTLGPVISPVMSGFIVEGLGWRWCFYILSMLNGAIAIFGTIFFKETYSPKLLFKKAQYLRKETGNKNLHTVFELTDDVPRSKVIKHTVLRPLKLLSYHPMILGLGSFMAFTYGFMYLLVVTFPRVYGGSYGFSTGISGLLFIPMGIGYLIGTATWTVLIQRSYDKLCAQNNGVSKPEYRLPCLLFSAIGLPIGLIIYGWSVKFAVHWMVPSIGSAIFAFSFVGVFQTIQNYLIDMNPRFSASSVAAAAMFRSLFGFAFPLFANQMYDKLGYGWGNTLCALLGLALGVPFPLFCMKYGERMRKWADRKMEKDQAEFDEKIIDDVEKA